MKTRPHIDVTLDQAKEQFDDLIALVEQGCSVGILEHGRHRGILTPVVDEPSSGSPVSEAPGR